MYYTIVARYNISLFNETYMISKSKQAKNNSGVVLTATSMH